MTDDYVRAKVAEALAAANNDRHDAQKLLITWAVRDQPLLLGMAKPHLKAIAAALLDHALRNKDQGTASDPGPDQFSPGAVEDIIASGQSAPKDRRIPRNIPPPKSTDRQASVMRKLAAAFTKKK